jgi:hypothetical protein
MIQLYMYLCHIEYILFVQFLSPYRNHLDIDHTRYNLNDCRNKQEKLINKTLITNLFLNMGWNVCGYIYSVI